MNDNYALIRNWCKAIARKGRPSYASPRFDTSDLVQESLLQFYLEQDKLSGSCEKESYSWLQKVLHGVLAKHLRFHNAQKRSVKKEQGTVDYSFHSSSQDSPLGVSVKNEQMARLLDGVARLEDQARQIVVLRFFKGATYSEISDELCIEVHIVRSKLAKSLRTLKELLEPPC